MKSDHAVLELKDDRIGWSSAARHFAELILESIDDGGATVLSIEGEWGSGKTTFTNFVVESLELLRPKKRNRPRIVNYDPWLNPNVIHSKYFFDQLASSVSVLSFFLRRMLRLFAETNEATKHILKTISEYLLLIASFGAVLGIAVQSDKDLAFDVTKNQLLLVTVFAVVASIILSIADRIINRPNISIFKIKSVISKRLRKHHRRGIVVFLDDLDRLSGNQILDVLQLVKNNGDLSNVVYVLCLDHEEICNRLKEDENISNPSRFLEKFIQTRFTVPALSTPTLRHELCTMLDEILASHPTKNTDQLWDKEKWESIRDEGILPLCKNIRQATRVANSFESKIELFISDEHFDVNPVDILALEALHTLSPQVYATFRSYPRLFVRDSTKLSLLDQSKDERREFFNKVMSTVDESDRAPVKKILTSIFPRVSSYEQSIGSRDEELDGFCFAEKGVCSDKISALYMSYSMGESIVSEKRLSDYLNRITTAKVGPVEFNLGRGELLYDVWNVLHKRSKLERFRFPSADGIEYALTNFFNCGDSLERSRDVLGSYPTEWPITWTIDDWLKRLESAESRRNIVGQSLRTTNGFWGPVYYLRHLEEAEDGRPSTARESLELDDVGLARFRKVVMTRILESITDPTLANSNDLFRVFAYLREYADNDEYAKALTRFVHKPENFRNLAQFYFVNRRDPRIEREIFEKDDFLKLDIDKILLKKLQDPRVLETFDQHQVDLIIESLK